MRPSTQRDRGARTWEKVCNLPNNLGSQHQIIVLEESGFPKLQRAAAHQPRTGETHGFGIETTAGSF